MSSGNTYAHYTGIDTTTEWNKSIDWISNTSLPQPTAVEMQTGMNAFLQNMRFANCKFNDTLSAVLRTCLPTNIHEYKEEPDIKIYPNPNAGVFTLVTTSTLLNSTIEITDALGRTVKRIHSSQSEKQIIDLSAFDKGFYLIRINNGERNRALKVLVE